MPADLPHAESPAQPVRRARTLGLSSASALVVASMIGTGVFTTSGFLLQDLRSRGLVLLAWLAGGIMAALGALSYGALARRLPESGGEYLFLSRTVHPAAGYVAGWISLLAGFSAPLAAAAFGFGEYTRHWWNCPAPLSGSLLILLFAAVHSGPVRRGARVQDWAVLIKIALILGLIAFGFTRIEMPPVESTGKSSVGAFAVSLVWISFSYAGWNAAIYVGGEISDPERNLPRALLLATGLVTLLYLGLNAVFVFSAPFNALAGKLEVGRIAAQSLGGPVLANAVTGLIALALTTSVSSMIMCGPRVYSQMAADGYLPKFLEAPAGPPRAAIALQTLLALAMLWTATYQSLLTYIGFTLALSSAATVFGLIRLRRQEPDLTVPGWPWVPGLFLACVLAMAAFSIQRRPAESLVGFATIGAGFAVWAVKQRVQKATP